MNKNFKITLSVLLAFTISFSALVTFVIMFSLSTDELIFHAGIPNEREQSDFYSQDFSSNEKKIFIFGSSVIWPLNSDIIEENLKKSDLDFAVYNLGIGGSKPENTEKVLDMIISAKPDVVAYGVSDRDFITDDPTSEKEILIQHLPEPSRIFGNLFLSVADFFNFDTEFLSTPLTSTLNVLRGSLNLPLLPIVADETIKNGKEVETYLEDLPLVTENKNLIALNNIITKLQENNIHVIIFVTPVHKYHIEHLSEFQQEYFNIILEIISDNSDIPVYSLYDYYRDLDIWYDFVHVTTDTDYPYFSNDLSKILLEELS